MEKEEKKALAKHIEKYLKDEYDVTLSCQYGGILIAIEDYFKNKNLKKITPEKQSKGYFDDLKDVL